MGKMHVAAPTRKWSVAQERTATPDIAVIMPMHNGRLFIEETLRSILDQEGVRIEVIVSDDGSTDGSAAIIEAMDDPRVRVVRTRGKGVPAGLNTALTLVAAPIFCRCDHDDHYAPGRLARQVAFLREHPEFGAVCGQFETMTNRGEVLAEMGTGDHDLEITQELRTGHILRTHMNTWAMRTSIARELGGFRDFGVTGEDNDMQLRFGEVSRVWFQAAPTYRWRLHDASITHTQPSRERVWAERLAWVFRDQRRERGRDDLMDGALPPIPDSLESQPTLMVRDQIHNTLTGAAWREWRRGNRGRAVRYAWRAIGWQPTKPYSWKTLALIALKPAR
jgi:glycosyltransferase involved in cell wall biosynthesis